jgi:hypothetical protein
MLAKTVCRILAVIFVVTGLATFIFGDTENAYHNLLHFVTGLVAVYFGFLGSKPAAKRFCVIFGGAYLAFGVLGILLGDPAMDRMWHPGPLHLALGDHIFHIVLGAIILTSGILTRTPVRPRGSARLTP